ncbi:DEAD/DEAH box helicase [Paracoccus benzoatiresistens]|uniref:DEAD/DEAH box helicase n=1 Tax=Paracoccus benzoatiresistens TaxID=2997341 RepID=A0ABT4J3X6_9RHOB|nr:DEAD/DEAH box helicase [Paracoccus sp. EF6]MCZ0961818.1 DEAD/DEAH box helicase [Paracoccus sp. EF6]
MIEELANRIWSHPKFHEETSALRRLVFTSLFGFVGAKDGFEDHSRIIQRLTQSAIALASSERREYRRRSYEIATNIAEFAAHDLPGSTYALLLALGRLGNFPALDFAKRRYSISEHALPQQMVAESVIRRSQNSVKIADNSISLTDFQLELWNKLNSGKTIGVSAPTSAGKSFVLQSFTRRLFEDDRIRYAAIIVPSRALITQVSEDASAWVKTSPLQVELLTTPVHPESALPIRALFVVTQERLQLLLAAHPFLKLQLLVIDEAQNLGDGPRGVLLSSVVEECLRRDEDCQMIFAGPNLSTPERLSRGFGRDAVAVTTDEPAVLQNIFFLETGLSDTKQAVLSFLDGKQPVKVGTIDCDQPLLDHVAKLVNLALRLGTSGQSLVYAYGPSECENIAFGLSDTEPREPTPGQLELSKFIKDAVHPDFQLASFVLQGVGYHYGRLPSLVRKAIEDAFGDGSLNFLVTTSTLLQGVNLPARNLFLRNPRKGEEPISSVDFWNLAGRAGRLGREFSGNIFLIDYGSWESDPLSGSADRSVEPSLQSHLLNRTDSLISYIDNREHIPNPREPDEFENTFVKLVQDHMHGRLAQTLSNSGLPDFDTRRVALEASISRAVASVPLRAETISASPTVSIYKQNDLLTRLEKSIKAKGPSYVIPKHPRDPGAYVSYVAVLHRCHQEILKLPRSDKSAHYYAQLILRWMRGDPLPVIIDANIEFLRARGRTSNTATVIRNTLTEIESDVRFKYVRLFSCYNAILEAALLKCGHKDSVKSIPAVPFYLEMGASSVTMMSFIGIGLSRFTSTRLQRLARREDMSQSEARSWIERQNIQSLDIPVASAKEIQRVLRMA